jgi:hypothetical protein
MARKPRTKPLTAKLREAGDSTGDALAKVPGPSPNPMTNLIITDIALRGGGILIRQAVERGLLRTKFSAGKARDIVKGRSLAQTLISTAVARIATRSVPGALLVGGAVLAKALYDRGGGERAAKAEGEKDIRERVKNAD